MKIFTLGLLFLSLSIANAQNSSITPIPSITKDSIKPRPILVAQLEFENGGMIPNNEEIRDDFDDIYYNGINLRIGWQSQKNSLYNKIYNYPIYGIGAYASTFNRDEIGTPYALYGFVAVPFRMDNPNRFQFNYRIGLGLAFNFRPYDPENNPVNVLLSTAENVYIDAGIQLNYRLNPHFRLGMGLAFHHFSNGSIRQPNRGINLVPLGLSVTYVPSKRVPNYNMEAVPKHIPKNAYHISFAGGLKQMSVKDRDQYFKSTLGLYYSRFMSYKWRIGAGADLFYSSTGHFERIAGEDAGKLKSLLSGGPAFYIDHVLRPNLYINGNVGYYLNRNNFNGEVKPIFLRIGLRYKFRNDMFTGVSIKAHKGKADYVEWTLGYTLFK